MSEQEKILTVSKEVVIHRLLQLPGEIDQAEKDYHQETIRVQASQDALAEWEVQLWANGLIEGKNDIERKNSLRANTTEQRNRIADANYAAARARMALSHRQNVFACYRSIARLMAGCAE